MFEFLKALRKKMVVPEWHGLNEYRRIEEPLANGYTKSILQRKQIALNVEGLTRWHTENNGKHLIGPNEEVTYIRDN